MYRSISFNVVLTLHTYNPVSISCFCGCAFLDSAEAEIVWTSPGAEKIKVKVCACAETTGQAALGHATRARSMSCPGESEPVVDEMSS